MKNYRRFKFREVNKNLKYRSFSKRTRASWKHYLRLSMIINKNSFDKNFHIVAYSALIFFNVQGVPNLKFGQPKSKLRRQVTNKLWKKCISKKFCSFLLHFGKNHERKETKRYFIILYIYHLRWQLIADHNEWPLFTIIRRFLFELVGMMSLDRNREVINLLFVLPILFYLNILKTEKISFQRSLVRFGTNLLNK